MIFNSNDETDFPQKLLLPNTQISRLGKVFASGSSANTKFSKSRLSKMLR